MVHYHCLAGFVYGCGINHEIDMEGGHTFVTPSFSDSSSNAEPTTPTSIMNSFNYSQNTTQTLLERMKKVEKDHEQEEETSQEEVLRQFQDVQSGERTSVFGLFYV